MNKIVTINIGGIAITIEEDAYDALRDYLKNINEHFANTENGEEIVNDIELRIAEMLQSKLTSGKVSINTDDVKEVAQNMGYPSDFEEFEEETTETQEPKAQQANRAKGRRRLFRDGENKRVGGVCGGLARYFDIDATILRILWFVSLAVFGFGFWLYIILWAVLPEAKTTAEKLEMMGEAPTIENIKNTIHKEATSAYNRIATPENRRTVSNFFEKIIDFLRHIFGAFFKLFAVLFFVGIIMALVATFIGFLFDGIPFHINNNMHIDGQTLHMVFTDSGALVFKIAAYLIFAIPLVYLAMKILPEIFPVPKPTKVVKQGVLSAWLLAIVIAIVGFFYNANQYRITGTDKTTKDLYIDSDTLVIRVNDLIDANYKDGRSDVRLDVVESVGDEIQLQVIKSARGRNEIQAKEAASNISNSYKLDGNTLMVSERARLIKDGNTRIPRLKLVVMLPVGKSVIFHNNTKRIIDDIKNLQDIYDPHMAGHTFEMTVAGLSCVDCTGGESTISGTPYENNASRGFNKVDVSGALRVNIIEGRPSNISIPSEGDFEDLVEVNINNNKLRLSLKPGTQLKSDQNKTIKVYMPNLKSLEVGGASKVKCSSGDKKKDYLDVSVEGASELRLEDVTAEKISLNLEGASKSFVTGNVDLMLVEMSGVSKLHADEVIADNINVDMSGASKAEVYALNELKGDMEGVSSLKYKGDPQNLSVKRSTAAKLATLD